MKPSRNTFKKRSYTRRVRRSPKNTTGRSRKYRSRTSARITKRRSRNGSRSVRNARSLRRRRRDRRRRGLYTRSYRLRSRSRKRNDVSNIKRGKAGLRKSAAAVVTCMNEQQTLSQVLRQLERLPLGEIIVVVNGSTDRSLAQAIRSRKTTVVWMAEALGHDVGRAVGARVSTADIVLFVDGDLPVRAEKLLPFLRAVDRGADLALNNLIPYVGTFADQDHVTRFKTFLNRVLRRPDLGMNSMTAVPHAVSRRLIRTIGFELLAVPPKAQAAALMSGLKVTAPASVNVIRSNRVRPHNMGERNPVADLIIGDHLEAINFMMQRTHVRGAFPDQERQRGIARGDRDADEYHYSVV